MPKLLSLLQPHTWALRPEALEALASLDVEIPAETRVPSPEPTADSRPYDLVDGVAVVSLAGVLMKNPGILDRLLDGAIAYHDIETALARALEDPEAGAVLLDIDSPGGTANGAYELAHTVAQANAVKPVFAFTAGQACSAAYLIASQAGRLAVTKTAETGSIGVYVLHADYSERAKALGIRHTIIKAGRYKAAGHPSQPLSDDDRQVIQERVDSLYEMFVADVARGRSLEPEAAHQVAEGRVYLGAQAVDAGLADLVVANREEFVNQIKESMQMTLEELKARHPEVYRAAIEGLIPQAQAEALAKEAAEAAAQAAAKPATEAERERVFGLVDALCPEALAKGIRSLADAGTTPGQVKAMVGVMGGITSVNLNPPDAHDLGEGEGSNTTTTLAAATAPAPPSGMAAAILEAIHQAAPKPLNTGKTAGGGGKALGGSADIAAQARAYAQEHDVSMDKAFVAIAQKDPKGYREYLEAQREGRR